ERPPPSVPADLRLTAASTDAIPDVESLHYGFGLFQIDDVRFGRVIGHAGGYPGFGSHMRWHPASGLGVIALANGRYTPTTLLAKELLGVLIQAELAPLRRTRPNAATRAARAAVDRLGAAIAGQGGAGIAEWPRTRPIGPDVDLAAIRRQLRAAEARFGPVELGPPIDGDGERKATYRLHGARGHLELALTFDPDAGCIAA